MNILDFEIFTRSIQELSLNNRMIINTINPHSYAISKDDYFFKKALKHSDVLLPDGVGILVATRILKNKRISKIAGYDIHLHFLEKLNAINGRVFYLGATQKTLKLIDEKIKVEFPNISVGNFSPPYKQNFDVQDSKKMIKAINDFEPNVLFVGMTAPKQEKWVYQNKEKINVKIIASVGAVFNFYSEEIKRSNKFWIEIGMEWFPRLIKEPRRLWKRTFHSLPIFMIDVIKEKITTSKTK